MTVKSLKAILGGLVVFAVAVAPAFAASSEDVGFGGNLPIPEAISEIPAMTVPHTVMNFDLMPAGPTTVAAISGAFPGSVMTNITMVTRSGTGVYNFQTAGGRALAALNLAGSLVLIDPPSGVFNNMNWMDIFLSADVQEFGFEIGDWGGPFQAIVSDNGTVVNTLDVSTSGGDIDHFLFSDECFDEVRLGTFNSFPVANWAVPSIHVPNQAATGCGAGGGGGGGTCDLTPIEAKLDILEPKVDVVDTVVDALEVKLDSIEPKIDTANNKLDALEVKVDALDVAPIEAKLDMMEPKVDDLQAMLAGLDAQLCEIVRLLHVPQGNRSTMQCGGYTWNGPNTQP